MSTRSPAPRQFSLPRSARIAIAAARFNAEIVDQLLADCMRRLNENGLADNRIDAMRVPGSFELPVACKAFCKTGKYSAVIALGVIIRGETPHFELVAEQCAAGLINVGLEFSLPVIFGVLATNNEKQARARTRGPHSFTGINAADAACEMIETLKNIREGNHDSDARRNWPAIKKSGSRQPGAAAQDR
jgi:6,7-dimethyl-8-ribityllumazine synthase